MRHYRETGYQVFFFCGMIAPVILGVIIISLGYITPDYNPVSDSISLMGIPGQPYAWILNNGYYLYGILMGFAAYGLNRIFGHVQPVRRLSALIIVHSLGTILLGVFPDSIMSFPKELLHNVVSGLAYAPLMIGIYIFQGITRYDASFRTVVLFGFFIMLVNLPMPFVHMTEPLSFIGGLLQRILSCFSYLWLVLIFILLYKARHSFETDIKNADFIPSSRRINKVSAAPAVTKVGNILQDTRLH